MSQKVMFVGKFIPQVLEVAQNVFLVPNPSKSGYIKIDQKSDKTEEILDDREGYNSYCTDLILPP